MRKPFANNLSEELLAQQLGPSIVQFPIFRRMADVGAVDDQRQNFALVNTASNVTSANGDQYSTN
jgi:hypothetical protein